MFILGDYKIGKTIGEGAFSKVKAAVHIPSGEKVAIKIINKELMNRSRKKLQEEFNDSLPDQRAREGVYGDDAKTKTFLSTIEKEVKLLMRLNHPNIIKTYQFIDGEQESFVVMQLAKEEMADLLIAKGRLSDKEGRKYFRQLFSGIDYIHRANVVHRDLKLENLLLDENYNLLISDFGLGRVISRDPQLLDTFCGTPNYAAAELVSAIPYLGTKSDIWYINIDKRAMGVILYFFMAGNTPFKGNDIHNLYEKIKTADYAVPTYFSKSTKYIYIGLADLISKILVPNPERRIDMEQIRIHPWVNENEISTPEIIEPDASKIVTENDLGKIISSINNDKEHVVYTFNQFKKSKMDPVLNIQKEVSMLNTDGSLKNDKLTVNWVTTRKRSQTASVRKTAFMNTEESQQPHNEIQFFTYEDKILNSTNMISASSTVSENKLTPTELTQTCSQNLSSADTSLGKSMINEFNKNLGHALKTLDRSPSGSKVLNVAQVKSRRRAETNFVGRTKITPVVPKLQNDETEFDETNPTTLPSMLIYNENFKRADSILKRMTSPIQLDEKNSELKIGSGEIHEWHNIHKPPKTIRSSKFIFNSKGSSARLEPAIMFQDIHRALMTMQAVFPETQLTFRRVDDYYMFNSEAKDSKGDLLEFTVELCQVWLLNLYAMKIRRTSGDAFLFKEIHDNLLNLIEWKK